MAPRSRSLFSNLRPPERLRRNLFYGGALLLGAYILWRALHPLHAFQTDRMNKDMGLWSLRFLFACLLLSPVSRWLRRPDLRRWRRPLGLAAAAFALLHTVHFLLWGRLWPDRLEILVTRPYMAIGLAGLLMLIPLALTSNDAAIRRLSPRRWRRLHLWVYPAAALSVIHEVLAFGPIKGEAGVYSVLTVLLAVARGVRLIRDARPGKRHPSRAPAGAAE
jgi:sulfoxide reductase heme-binding subunit YedZ